MVIDLPWPSRDLHPNARIHYMAKARAVKKARETAAWLAKSYGVKRIDAASLKVAVIFHPPDLRRRDRDGMLSSCKAYFDGIADVVGVDDFNWDISMRKGEPRPNGCVRVVLGASSG